MIKDGNFQDKSFFLVPVFGTTFSQGINQLRWFIVAICLDLLSISALKIKNRIS